MAASLPGDCAQVRQLIAEKKVSADALCRAIVSVSSTTLSPMAAINYRFRSLPHTEDYWTAFDRFYACVHDRRVLQFFRPATLSVVGSIPLNTYAAVQLDRKSLTPTTMVESSLGLRSGTGTVTAISPKTTVCSGCTVLNSAVTKPSSTRYQTTGKVNVASPGAGKRREASVGMEVTVTAQVPFPFVLVNKSIQFHTVGVLFECDAETIGAMTSPGCVFPDVTPAILFDGRTPENGGTMYTTAIHMSDAMNSGLPGSLSGNTVLHRTNSPTIRDANRNAACPTSLTRPTGYNCDEYPFASSLEGGAANTREARTFWYCKLNDPVRTGPLGFSRCMAPVGEHVVQGNTLNSGYMDQRVRNGDAYQVGWSQV